MAVTRIVDPRLFAVEAAYVDWTRVLRLHAGSVGFARMAAWNPDDKLGITVALRWHVNATQGNVMGPDDERGIGLPTGPFTVWRRPSFGSQLERVIGFDQVSILSMFGRMYVFDQPLATARLELNSTSGGVVFGLANTPNPMSIATQSQAPSGNTQIEIHGSYLDGVLVPPGMVLTDLFGVPVEVYESLPEWERIEIVGLPVEPADWVNVGTHADDQGPVGGLMSPRDAAIDRIVRGTPPFGWETQVAPGVHAPMWEAPDPSALVDEVRVDVVTWLRSVLDLPQMDQAAARPIEIDIPPPETLHGRPMTASSNLARVSPIMSLRIAVATDPFSSLALGYGTNLVNEPQADVKPYHDGSRWDYMITAPYDKGLDGESEAVELVAYALRPTSALRPFAPAQLSAEERAILPPVARDDVFGASSTVKWSRPPRTAIERVSSYAASRHDPGDTDARPLMESRPSGGLRPIGPGGEKNDQAFVYLADRYFAIPNDPGNRSVHYSVATQDLFGIWSPWVGVDYAASQPTTAAPRVMASTLHVTAPPSGKVCPGELEIDVSWDWTDRSPSSVYLVGRMYAAADRASVPPSTVIPGGLDRSLGGGGLPVTLTFSGDDATLSGAPGGSLQYLAADGSREVFDPADQGTGIRRYRLRIPGLTADFGATPHIGFALWLYGYERIAPQHGAAVAEPVLAYASDPVAPPVPPEIVPLGSLPDADGHSHARISWPAAAGAAGYAVYESDELTLLAHYGLPEPAASATLSDRADVLLDAWEANPDRRPFTRLTGSPLTATSLDVRLARGSTAIHAYVVISTSPGQVEGPWPRVGPGIRDQVILRAAPRIAAPAPPEVTARARDDGSVLVTMTTRAGHRVGRLDLYRVRVDDAARNLDTMGPPVATITPPAAGWTTTDLGDGLVRITGADTPGPSWKRVWYRAVAWADDEWVVDGLPFPYRIAQRGLVPGRSLPSNAIAVVVPPAGPPDLGPIAVSWPGGGIADVQLDWTTTAPRGITALGRHRIDVAIGPPDGSAPPLEYTGTLDGVPLTPPTGDGIWRTDAGSTTQFHAIVHRTSTDVVLDASVQLADPLGRVSSQRARVPGGPLLPAPDLADLEVVAVPGGVVLSFTSGSPIARFSGGSAYSLRVSAQPRAGGPLFPPFPPIAPIGIRPGRLGRPLRPLPGVSPEASVEPPTGPIGAIRPGEILATELTLPGGRFPVRPRPIVLAVELPDVPLDDGSVPSGAVLQIRRVRGGGSRHAYGVYARVAVVSFQLQLNAPDGRATTASAEVPGP